MICPLMLCSMEWVVVVHTAALVHWAKRWSHAWVLWCIPPPTTPLRNTSWSIRCVTLLVITETTVLVPYLEVKSLQLIWRSGTRRFHLRVHVLQMSCRDLTTWEGTRIVDPVMATRVTCLIPTITPSPWTVTPWSVKFTGYWTLSGSIKHSLNDLFLLTRSLLMKVNHSRWPDQGSDSTINSLWPSDIIWWQGTLSRLVQLVAVT